MPSGGPSPQLASLRALVSRLTETAYRPEYVNNGKRLLALLHRFIRSHYGESGLLAPFPVLSDNLVAEFLTWLRTDQKSSPSSLRSSLSCLLSCYKRAGCFVPFAKYRTRLVIRAMLKEKNLFASSAAHSEIRPVKKRRAPLTFWALLEINRRISFSSLLRLKVFAFMVLATFGLFRASELVLNPSVLGAPLLINKYVQVFKNKVTIFLRSSKGDRLCKGVYVSIPVNDSDICPKKMVSLIRSTQSDSTPSAPFFQNEDGSPLVYPDLLSEFRAIMTYCFPMLTASECSTHSARIGGASSLVLLGGDPTLIREFGRWSGNSVACFRGYVRLPDIPADGEGFPAILKSPAKWSRLWSGVSSHKELFGGAVLKDTSMLKWNPEGPCCPVGTCAVGGSKK